jgi:hypothetical protein
MLYISYEDSESINLEKCQYFYPVKTDLLFSIRFTFSKKKNDYREWVFKTPDIMNEIYTRIKFIIRNNHILKKSYYELDTKIFIEGKIE